jgi:predicted GNAT family acetyltransferase
LRDPAGAHESWLRSLAAGDGNVLWEVGGAPVAWACARSPVVGMSRIGPVYTPPERRGRGYGSAVTAAASVWARGSGAREVVLFTDLSNPVSNSIYQRIGYRAVSDAVDVAFIAP